MKREDEICAINAIRLYINKERYISILCGYFGCPDDVLNTLVCFCTKYPFLNSRLQKQMKHIQEDSKRWNTPPDDYETVNRGGCYDCEWGNGEGGCTIPDYCPNK